MKIVIKNGQKFFGQMVKGSLLRMMPQQPRKSFGPLYADPAGTQCVCECRVTYPRCGAPGDNCAWYCMQPPVIGDRECYQLTKAELAQRISVGWTQIGGPYADQNQCATACVEPVEPIQTNCCTDPIPSTVYCTLFNNSGCECLDEIVVELNYNAGSSNPGINFYVWTGQSDACAGFVHVSLICFTPGAFPFGWRLSVRCNGISNGEFDVQANGKTCPPDGDLEILFGPMTTEADTCCSTGSSTFTAIVTAL